MIFQHLLKLSQIQGIFDRNYIKIAQSSKDGRIAKMDPYTIDELQFYIQKNKRVISLKSILLSIFILVLTIIISYESLQNIWASRSDLEIYSSDRQLSNEVLTSSPICVISKHIGQQTPLSTLTNKNLTSLVQTTIERKTQFDAEQSLLNIVNGKGFYCYNLQNVVLNIQNTLHLQVQDVADVIIKTHSIEQALENRNDQYYTLSTKQSLEDNQQITYYVEIKKFRSQIYDKLYVNYDPLQKLQLSQEIVSIFADIETSILDKSMTIVVRSEATGEYQFTNQIQIIRENIGEILGKFFSWLTILIILLSVIIQPLADYNFKIKLVQNIYDNIKLSKIQFSVVSYGKYLLSQLKEDLFDEQILEQTFKKLENDLNILNLVKKQMVVRKLALQLSLQSGEKSENYAKIQNNQQTQFGLYLLKVDNQLSSEKQIKDQTAFKDMDNEEKQYQKITDFIANNSQIPDKSFAQSLISKLDIGQTAISLITNKGQGYGNKWNFILSLVFFVLVLTFLIVAGFVSVFQNQNIKTNLEGKEQKHNQLIFQRSNIIFRGIKANFFDSFVAKAEIIDEDQNVVQQLTINSGTNCSTFVEELGQTGADWLCLPKTIIISNNKKGQRYSLLIYLQSTGFFSELFSKFEVKYKSHIYINGDIIQKIKSYDQIAPTNIHKIQLQLFQKESQQKIQSFWSTPLPLVLKSTSKRGVLFELAETYQLIQIQQNTIWDIIDNSWGIFILCFTIILSKISLRMNMREREKITSDQANFQRNNMVGVLLTQNKLGKKLLNSELHSINYFYKSKYNIKQSDTIQ